MSTQLAHIENRRKSKPSGWQIHSERMKGKPMLPAGQSQFEMLLYRLGIEERDLKASLHPLVIEFARKNYEQRFIPVFILEQLGLMCSRFDV